MLRDRPNRCARISRRLELLKLSDELDRLINPRHTDHDRHTFLPRKIADRIAAARREIQNALHDLG